MRKTLLAAIAFGAVASAPAFAQVQLGGAARVGADAGVQAPVHGALQTVDHTGTQVTQTTTRTARQTRDAAHRTVDGVNPDASVNANVRASTRARAAGDHGRTDLDANARANVDAERARNRTEQTAHSVDHQIRQTTRSTLQTAHQNVLRAGDAASRTTQSDHSVGVHGEGSASLNEH